MGCRRAARMFGGDGQSVKQPGSSLGILWTTEGARMRKVGGSFGHASMEIGTAMSLSLLPIER